MPSVRETAAQVEVNSNTVMRSYDWLQSQQIIYTKRGLGFYVSPGAKQTIHQIRKEEFVQESVPEIVRSMQTLGISVSELTGYINKVIA